MLKIPDLDIQCIFILFQTTALGNISASIAFVMCSPPQKKRWFNYPYLKVFYLVLLVGAPRTLKVLETRLLYCLNNSIQEPFTQDN